MTFRVRPTASRSTTKRTRTWDERSRRSMLLNVGFAATVVVALLLLALAFGVQWYDDHLAAAASVNGQTVTKDAFVRQLDVNAFRTDYQKRRIRTLLTAGRIRPEDAEARQALLDQRTQNAGTIALEQLIDGMVMADLAATQGITVTEADIDARIAEEATTPELRHAWVIAVAPEIAEGETEPTEAAVAAAKATAEQALADLRAGKAWEEVARAVSTDPTREQGGDIGYIDESTSLDEAFVQAVMAASNNEPTAVVEGDDGIFRIGRASEIVAPVVDATLESQAADAGISAADFRAAIGREVLRTKLNDAIVAQALQPGPQRKVSEIYMAESQSENMPGAVRVRHILYSPNDDPQGASQVPADDPAWANAEQEARAAYEAVKADPSTFDALARAESDEGAETSGGKLPYFAPGDGLDQAFADAIFKAGLQPGQLLEPVKSGFGWHVIQVMHYPTDMEWANQLKSKIEAGELSFADAARDNSEAAEAADGGDRGWVGRSQLGPDEADRIFAAPLGRPSDPVKVDGEGVYLYLVSADEIRTPDEDQKAEIESTAFPIWYSQRKAEYDISREASVTAPDQLTTPVQPGG
jgi:parvulin-like peptidyl-prolyl isomerase